METLAIFDLMMRGGAAGVSFILAACLAYRAHTSAIARYGALFALGAACYAFASAPIMAEATPLLGAVLRPFAVTTGVLFWWFALAMFCDSARWSPHRLIPFVIVLGCSALVEAPTFQDWARVSHLFILSITTVLMIHVIGIIASEADDDLVEPRRKFRTVWAGAISLTVLTVCVVEIWTLFQPAPASLPVLKAAFLLVATGSATIWSLSAQPEFFPEDRKPTVSPREPSVLAVDTYLARRLHEAMASGVFKEPGLNVGTLAHRLGAPEHRLRAVINQQLGYRNFSNFLNEHRISEARRRLEDPTEARRQILHLALDLGYNSIAPFNRAFRESTGMTPTQYRRGALDSSLSAGATDWMP